jgi:prophage maintenance system killer protein
MEIPPSLDRQLSTTLPSRNLPRNKRSVNRLSAALIESAHDFGIAVVWPGLEPVKESTCLDLNLLHSAAHQPYQECFGQELYPTLAAKAAYLFLHIASGHIFSNGNKRTATLCLDAFLTINSHYLILSNAEIHNVAQSAASFGERGESFHQVLASTTKLIAENALPFKLFRKDYPKEFWAFHKRKRAFINMPANQQDAPLVQRR